MSPNLVSSILGPQTLVDLTTFDPPGEFLHTIPYHVKWVFLLLYSCHAILSPSHPFLRGIILGHPSSFLRQWRVAGAHLFMFPDSWESCRECSSLLLDSSVGIWALQCDLEFKTLKTTHCFNRSSAGTQLGHVMWSITDQQFESKTNKRKNQNFFIFLYFLISLILFGVKTFFPYVPTILSVFLFIVSW